MSEFQLYFELGYQHILDIQGYDHILFVISLCTIYLVRDWQRVLVLVTAFTIGHSITLALATLKLINYRTEVIEFLIPVTILITALSNILKKDRPDIGKKIQANYILALVFGLIHGLGFSNYLRALLGGDRSIVSQLLAFNIGLEVGQIIIVAIFLSIGFIFVEIFGVKRRDWKLIISSAIGGIAWMLIIENKFW